MPRRANGRLHKGMEKLCTACGQSFRPAYVYQVAVSDADGRLALSGLASILVVLSVVAIAAMPWLMLLLAAVMIVNVLIWTLPTP